MEPNLLLVRVQKQQSHLQIHWSQFEFQQITPLRGPREGGTLVTIRGENLGLEFREIQDNVKVAEVDCTPIREGYIPAEQ